jgi:hypothetical protein
VIHHASIPARDTHGAATVLLELLGGGTLTRFGPFRDSWIAWSGDEHGTAIEVYPGGTELFPPATDDQAQFRTNPAAGPWTATHLAVSVPHTEEEVLEIAGRAGWRALRLDRGGFDVIEVWVENHVMLEILTPAMAADYLEVAPRRP